MDGCSGILAALDLDHEEGEEKEEHGHAEAHAVHGLVADEDVTVHMASFTKPRNLEYTNGGEEDGSLT